MSSCTPPPLNLNINSTADHGQSGSSRAFLDRRAYVKPELIIFDGDESEGTKDAIKSPEGKHNATMFGKPVEINYSAS